MISESWCKLANQRDICKGCDRSEQREVSRYQQHKEYKKFISNIKRRKTREINKVSAIFEEEFTKNQLTARFKKLSVGRFLDKLPLHEVEDAMFNVVNRVTDPDGAASYFCGICWNKIREAGAR